MYRAVLCVRMCVYALVSMCVLRYSMPCCVSVCERSCALGSVYRAVLGVCVCVCVCVYVCVCERSGPGLRYRAVLCECVCVCMCVCACV